MIQKFELTATHMELDDRLKKYVTKKLAGMDKYLSKQVRPSAHLEVRLKEHSSKGQKQAICDVTLHLPHGTIKIRETTQNIFASIDIVEAKLKQQIRRYKESHTDGKRRRRLFARRRTELAAEQN
jgi:putative sigma-54 modulation protein